MRTKSLHVKLRHVFSFREAVPELNKYLSMIKVDDDHPGFLFDWDKSNLEAFVAAANAQDPADAPAWLRTAPPRMTASSFADDVLHLLQAVAGGRCGRVLLAPNRLEQLASVQIKLVELQTDAFLQEAARQALTTTADGGEQYLATTHYIIDPDVEQSAPNDFQNAGFRRNGLQPCRLFIRCTMDWH